MMDWLYLKLISLNFMGLGLRVMPSKKTAKKRATKKKPVKRTKQAAKSGFGAKLAHFRESAFWRYSKFIGIRVFLSIFVLLLGLTAYLDISIRKQFEGNKWALPAHVYTRPLELYVGQNIDRKVIQDELNELGYVERNDFAFGMS